VIDCYEYCPNIRESNGWLGFIGKNGQSDGAF